MGSLLSFFGHFGHCLASPQVAQDAQIAGTVVSTFSPGLGAVVELIAAAVFAVEQNAAAGTVGGADKKMQVKSILDIAAPVVVSVLGTVSGKPVTNAAAVAPALDALINDAVALFHALDVFKHSPKVEAPIPPVGKVA